MTIEGPPPPEEGERLAPGGPGVARAAGRGLPVAPMGGEREFFCQSQALMMLIVIKSHSMSCFLYTYISFNIVL